MMKQKKKTKKGGSLKQPVGKGGAGSTKSMVVAIPKGSKKTMIPKKSPKGIKKGLTPKGSFEFQGNNDGHGTSGVRAQS